METSLLLAQLIGTYFVLMGIAIFVRPNMAGEMIEGFERNKALMLITGIFVFVGGFLIVSAHNIWEASWVGFVTIMAWATMIKGAMYILWPEYIMKSAHWFVHKGTLQKAASVVLIITGLYLAYIGFGIAT